MIRGMLFCFTLAVLIGCAKPVSSSCMESQRYKVPENNYPPDNSKCDAQDAAVYVIAATIKTMQEQEKEKKEAPSSKEPVKCSDMIGNARKDCLRKEKELNDPLDEF
ncbi:hypothetical protein [Litorilituus lipolyticus]|uniref:Lipoprotein n=1 Tax=Litorilituus lipolyticus TaxID=2491017 RepID=A0A502L273_9GAMM|nr:hypothetical protein [Litorilituus lipolyticus]TPH16093.1 hypothetical protein EPA86_07315 [Litorilituus lipolyticus]